MVNAGETLREIVYRRLDIGEATSVGHAIYTGRHSIAQIIQARLQAWGIGFPCPLLAGVSATLDGFDDVFRVVVFGRHPRRIFAPTNPARAKSIYCAWLASTA